MNNFEKQRNINIGLIGYGNVGKGVVRYFNEGRGESSNINLKKVAVSNLSKPRDIQFSNLTDNVRSIINDPSIDVVVELVGGTGAAKEYVYEALNAGKSVVTANKAVISENMPELFKLAKDRKAGFAFEASVGGGIPIIRTLFGYQGQRITSIEAILNGTTNFILSRMENGSDFYSALKIAQEKGFAEADHILDTGGFDFQAKLSILASLVLNSHIKPKDIPCSGITKVTPIDIDFASKFGIEEGERGYAVKLLASAKEHDGRWDLSVSPTLISKDHPLASVRDEYNAVTIEGDLTGLQTFIGKGAGTNPTSSAVISDIYRLSDDIRHQTQGCFPSLNDNVLYIEPKNISERGYIRVDLIDLPRSLQGIMEVFGDNNLSISDSLQRKRFTRNIDGKSYVPDIEVLHLTNRSNIENALEQLASLDRVYGEPFYMRFSE